ncbi:MAG TPA: tRNA preQ1(34) S-adenosylmethionine ribosyltransferase-isomerase QueA [Spirochaetaceae bacterium]|jgi:S-adenosylmethionine:tRNA ribosyltransferase-isomerase|nr:tRNA preQ1(34) S-adenosylmethionine ribosyltransferase-isomerase QueA [Spirochaetaceae bacterium]
MKTQDFSFKLPPELIAQEPSAERGASRLLLLDRNNGSVAHSMVAALPELIAPGTVMVFNDSKVRRARLFATNATGGAVELLLLRREGDRRWAAMTTRMAKQKPGKRLLLPEGLEAEVLEARPDERLFLFSKEIDDEYLERNGHLPLPPYIRRGDRLEDAERYQTVYARQDGSAAAPTAGLHFTPAILEALRARGVELRFITLHVGLGTFMPVRVESVEDHLMHQEDYSIPEDTALAVNRAKAEGRPVLAVGTTSVRSMESAWTDEGLKAGPGSTRIFIYPGYAFKSIDALFTNFHTPESTLLMLVSAFAGKERILAAYEEAVRQRYRFFSYGDAMLIR